VVDPESLQNEPAPVTDGVGDGAVIMPFYLLLDVSQSMKNDEDALNSAVAKFIEDIQRDPVVDDLVMISIIAFNHEARTVVPLGSPSELDIPKLRASGGTAYSEAFIEYNKTFEADRRILKRNGVRVYRPCVFFLTDGAPSDRDYLDTFRALFAYDPESRVGNPAFPFFVPCGFRDARKDVIVSLAYPDFGPRKGRWLLSRTNTAGVLLRVISEVFTKMVVASGTSAYQGSPHLALPLPPPGLDIQFGEAGDFVD
jgi:hypothetical protein